MMRHNRLALSLTYCLVGLLLPWTAQACQCEKEPTLQSAFQGAFQDAQVVIKATLLKNLTATSSTDGVIDLRFSAKLLRALKGCSSLKGADIINVITSSQESLCGVDFLKPGTTYLLSGSLDASKKSLSVYSCRYQAEWNKLNATQVELLSQKYSNCTCTAQSCGKRPGNYQCPDGVTVGGPSKCSYNQKLAACAWEIVKCPTCQKHSDCRKGQFCSYGKCRAVGTCGSNVDCWNPKNSFTKSANCTSTGRPSCSKSNKCYLNCSQTCGTGAACFADPCAVTPCKVPHVSCARNYCGGCNAIFYNSSGYQVCK